MADDPFETLLKAWGLYYHERAPAERGVRSRVSHPIAMSMQFGAKKVKRATREVLGRDGRGRRAIMGGAVGIEGFGLVPMAFVDPVRCKETRSGGGSYEGRPVPKELQNVDMAVRELEELSVVRAMCIRVQYCMEGDHATKVCLVNERMERVTRGFERIGLSRYRDELLYGRVWLHGRLTPALQRA